MAQGNGAEDHLALDEALGVAELASSVQRLMILQDLSNDYGTTYKQDIQKAPASWSDLAHEVGQETARLAHLARRHRNAVLGKPELLERQYESALDSPHLDAATKQKFTSGIEAAGGFVAWVTSSIDTLEGQLPAQRQTFFDLADRIAVDGTESTEAEGLIASAIKEYIVCGLYGAAMGAAAATGNVFGFFIAAAAAVNYGCFG